MPLILAVEPDKKQAAKIVSLGRGTLKAEVVVAESAHSALQLLAGRVPDLILTSLLLSPRDEAVLTDRLRELDSAASHVQTLVIPVLATARRARKQSVGLLKRLTGTKRKDGSPDGCDPDVFAAQIQEYLERAAVDREHIQGAAEQVVSEQHKHLYGDAWAHVDEKSAAEALNAATATDLPDDIDPAFALPLDETSWPEPVPERGDFLRILDDEMLAADQPWTETDAAGPAAGEGAIELERNVVDDPVHQPSPTLFTPHTLPEEPLPELASFDVVKDPVDEPLSVIRPEPVWSPIYSEPFAPASRWAELESPADTRVADEAETVYEPQEAAESVDRPYEVLFTPVRTLREETVPQVEAFDVVKDPASEPISVIRAETATTWPEPVRETYPAWGTPDRTTHLEPLSVIRADPSEPLPVIRAEAFAPATTDPEPADDRFWARDFSSVLKSQPTSVEPLTEVAAFDGATSESLSVIRPEAYTTPPAEEASSAASLEWEEVESFAIEPPAAEAVTFERDAFAEPDRATRPALFTPADASNREPLVEAFGFNVEEDVVPPAAVKREAAPLGIDDEWAEVLLGGGARDTHPSGLTEDTGSMALPDVSKDSIFDLDTTSARDFDAFIRELSGSPLEREAISPSVAAEQPPEPEPPQPMSVSEPALTFSIAPAPDESPALNLAPKPDSVPPLILTPPSEPVPAPTLAPPPETAQAAQAASPAAAPSPALPQLEVLEMLTAIRRDLEQMKSERPPIAAQTDTQAAQAAVAITPSQPAESQPRAERQPKPKAPRLTKSAARREKRPEPPRRKKRNTPAPIQDEWGFFDPDQCGFSALLAKLEEIESEKPPDED